MGYMLVADNLKSPWGHAKFGVAPRHPKVQGDKVVGFKSGKIPEGMSFEWFGDPEKPPAWASPKCEDGRKAYLAMCTRVLEGNPTPMKKMRYEALIAHVRGLDFTSSGTSGAGGGSSDVSDAFSRIESIERALRGEVVAEKAPDTSVSKELRVPEKMFEAPKKMRGRPPKTSFDTPKKEADPVSKEAASSEVPAPG